MWVGSRSYWPSRVMEWASVAGAKGLETERETSEVQAASSTQSSGWWKKSLMEQIA